MLRQRYWRELHQARHGQHVVMLVVGQFSTSESVDGSLPHTHAGYHAVLLGAIFDCAGLVRVAASYMFMPQGMQLRSSAAPMVTNKNSMAGTAAQSATNSMHSFGLLPRQQENGHRPERCSFLYKPIIRQVFQLHLQAGCGCSWTCFTLVIQSGLQLMHLRHWSLQVLSVSGESP